MDNREAVTQAFEEFNAKPGDKIPDVLERYFQRVAVTGETLYDWDKLKLAFRSKLDQAMKTFHDQVPTDHFLPTPNVENVKFDEMRTRLMNVLDTFTGAPFTIQRLCELVTNPHKHYMRTDKFLRGIEKNLMIVSAVDPYGNKIVSEGKSRPYINGLDANGVEPGEHTPERKDSPFFPPPPVNSPAASSWFSNLTPTNSPIGMRSPWQRAGAGDASSSSNNAAMLQAAFTEESWTENELDEFGHGPPEKKSRLSIPKPSSGMMEANQSSDGYFGAGSHEQKFHVGGASTGRNMFDPQVGSSKYRITGSDVEIQDSEAGVSGSESAADGLANEDEVSSESEDTGVSSAMDTDISVDNKRTSGETSQSIICSSMNTATSSSESVHVSQSVVVSSHVTDSSSSSSSCSSIGEPDSDSSTSADHVHSSLSELTHADPTSSSQSNQVSQATPSDASSESSTNAADSVTTPPEGNEATSICSNTESVDEILTNQVEVSEGSSREEPSSAVDSSNCEPSVQSQSCVDQSGQECLDDSPSDDLRDSRDSQGFDLSPDLDENDCEKSPSQSSDDLGNSRPQQEVSSSSESKPSESCKQLADSVQSTVSVEESSSSSSSSSSEVHSQSLEVSVASPEAGAESAEATASQSESHESSRVESPNVHSSDVTADDHVSSQPEQPAATDSASAKPVAVEPVSDAVSASTDAHPTSASSSQEDSESGRRLSPSPTDAFVNQVETHSEESEPSSTVAQPDNMQESSSESTSSSEQQEHEPMDTN